MANAKQEAIQSAYDEIRKQITDGYTNTYAHAQSMSYLIDAMINEAVQNAISVFDSSEID